MQNRTLVDMKIIKPPHHHHPMFLNNIVTTQPNINLTQLRLRLDIIIKPNPPHPTHPPTPHKLPKLAIWETSNR